MIKPPFLSLDHVSHRYGRRKVLHEISLTLFGGEVFGLLGPNGAGKTTLISLLATLMKPTSGEIMLEGHSIVHHPDRMRRRLGYVPQELALHTVLSGRENLRFWAGVYGLSGIERERAVSDALQEVGLSSRADERVDTWSGGMKRRLNIAAALMHHPDLLIMDEPTVGVDAHSRRAIANVIHRFQSEGKTILLASHDLDELEAVCTRVGLMHRGQFLSVGTVQEVLAVTGHVSLESCLVQLEEPE